MLGHQRGRSGDASPCRLLKGRVNKWVKRADNPEESPFFRAISGNHLRPVMWNHVRKLLRGVLVSLVLVRTPSGKGGPRGRGLIQEWKKRRSMSKGGGSAGVSPDERTRFWTVTSFGEGVWTELGGPRQCPRRARRSRGSPSRHRRGRRGEGGPGRRKFPSLVQEKVAPAADLIDYRT